MSYVSVNKKWHFFHLHWNGHVSLFRTRRGIGRNYPRREGVPLNGVLQKGSNCTDLCPNSLKIVTLSVKTSIMHLYHKAGFCREGHNLRSVYNLGPPPPSFLRPCVNKGPSHMLQFNIQNINVHLSNLVVQTHTLGTCIYVFSFSMRCPISRGQ